MTTTDIEYEQLFNDRCVLITGGTGSLGRALTKRLLKYKLRKLVILSRDELKQHEMQQDHVFDAENIRYLLGDVRDLQRLKMAFSGMDYVIHAAALKQIPALEYNPIEAIKTNIQGTQNVIEACCENHVEKAIFISSDKAVDPVNLYGATKLCGEKLFIASNAYARTKFAIVRYGNVIGSRGSVVEVYRKLIKEGAKTLPLTHREMTRFWITLDQAVDLVLAALGHCQGGETYIRRMPSARMIDLIETMMPGCEPIETGIRPGEKLHETMVSNYNQNCVFLVDGNKIERYYKSYNSNDNDWCLGINELKAIVNESI